MLYDRDTPELRILRRTYSGRREKKKKEDGIVDDK